MNFEQPKSIILRIKGQAAKNKAIDNYLKGLVSKEHPIVILQFLLDCKEIDIDAVAKDGDTY